jgi:hypothetical protein
VRARAAKVQGDVTPPPDGLEIRERQAHILAMEALAKIALLAGLAVLTLGIIPDRRRGALLAIGTCIAAAAVLHFVAP